MPFASSSSSSSSSVAGSPSPETRTMMTRSYFSNRLTAQCLTCSATLRAAPAPTVRSARRKRSLPRAMTLTRRCQRAFQALIEGHHTLLHEARLQQLMQAKRDIHILGGIDKRELSLGTEQVRAEVAQRYDTARRYGRYIPCVDHGVPPESCLAITFTQQIGGRRIAVGNLGHTHVFN